MKRIIDWRAIAAIALLFAASAQPTDAREDPFRKLRVARTVYEELMEIPDKAAPRWMEKDARCIAVIPSVIKGAFFWGGRHGNGVISCRNEEGWSPPAFVEIGGGSFGFQFGGESADLVLFFMNERGVRSLLTSKFVLGGDASVVAGPVGRKAEASTDARLKAEIYAYARARGLFAGVSIEGARLAADQKMIRRFYGQRIFPEEILFDHRVPALPQEAESFLRVLP